MLMSTIYMARLPEEVYHDEEDHCALFLADAVGIGTS